MERNQFQKVVITLLGAAIAGYWALVGYTSSFDLFVVLLVVAGTGMFIAGVAALLRPDATFLGIPVGKEERMPNSSFATVGLGAVAMIAGALVYLLGMA